MKKIANGKKYDTETAHCVGTDSYSHPGDFDFWEESLYQKKTGEFFLYGVGGARSRYCREIEQNTWSGGEEIIPLTKEEAMEWSEKHLSGDAFEEIFGEVEE